MAKRLQLITNVAFIAPVLGTSATICVIFLLTLLIVLLTSREGLPLIRLYSILGLALFSMSLIFCLVAFVVPVDGTLDEVISLSLSDICWSLGMIICCYIFIENVSTISNMFILVKYVKAPSSVICYGLFE